MVKSTAEIPHMYVTNFCLSSGFYCCDEMPCMQAGRKGVAFIYVAVPLPPIKAALDEAGGFSYTEKKKLGPCSGRAS